MKTVFSMLRVAAAALALFLPVHQAFAQTVTQQPQFVAPGAVLDAGNGPLEFRVLTGNTAIFTSQGSGVGSGTTTSITLTASAAANPPCIGCAISGGTLGPTSVVTAFNGTTGITVNTSQTVAATTALAWGKACPTGQPTNPAAFVQAAVGADMPFYTYARICLYGATGPGAQFLSFPIGAH